MDFGALPPEVNSALMYSGPGSGPMLAAAMNWDGLAAELHCTAAGYGTVIAELASTTWQGPSSVSMAAAAAPYAAWLSATATVAGQTALQAKAAAGAYEAAFAATVPPPVIAANRALLASLIATNFLGQNTPAIAATEAHYGQMWAQDAAAMFGYAGSAAAATRLTPFGRPPETTNAGGAANQSATVARSAADATLAQLGSDPLHGVATAAATATPITSDIQEIMKTISGVIGTVAGPYSPIGVAGLIKNWWQVAISIPSLGTALQSLGPTLAPKVITGALAPLLASELLTGSHGAAGLGTVSGALGRAGVIGSLSVPANWASAVPAVRAVATAIPQPVLAAAPVITNGQNGLFGQMALSSLAGRALAGSLGHAVGGTTTHPVGAVSRVTNTALADDIATTATIIVIPPHTQ